MHPGRTPRNICERAGREPLSSSAERVVSAAAPCSRPRNERGVAAETASAPPTTGEVKFVITEAKETSSTMRAVMAGFAKFCPTPPKNCFTTTIATKAPITQIHSGVFTGRLNASSMPVITAVRSPTVLGRRITRRARYSNNTELPTHSAMSHAARKPNTATPAHAAGIRAMITSSITPRTV